MLDRMLGHARRRRLADFVRRFRSNGKAIVGFTIAMHLRNRWVVALFVGIELILLIWLRDNMTLNLIMLVCPIPGLREWQAGG
jgi:predicted alpha/beta hydrolase